MADFSGFLRGLSLAAGASAEAADELALIIRSTPDFQVSDLNRIARNPNISDDLRQFLGEGPASVNRILLARGAELSNEISALKLSNLSDADFTARAQELFADFSSATNLDPAFAQRFDQSVIRFLDERRASSNSLMGGANPIARNEQEALDAYSATQIDVARQANSSAADIAAQRYGTDLPDGEVRPAAEATSGAAGADETPGAADGARVADDDGSAGSASRAEEPESPFPGGERLDPAAARSPADAGAGTLYSNPIHRLYSMGADAFRWTRRAFDNGPSVDGSQAAVVTAAKTVDNYLNRGTLGLWGWWLKPPIQNFIIDPARIALRTPEYLHRLFDWRYADHKVTQGMFAAADSLKETNAARLLFAINPSRATKNNVIFGNTNLTGALANVGDVLARANSDLADQASTLSSAMRAASEDLSNVAAQLQAARDLSRQTLNIRSQAGDYTSFSQEMVARSDFDVDGVISRLRVDANNAPDSDIQRTLETALEQMEELKANKYGMSATDYQAEASRITRSVANDLTARADSAATELDQITASARDTLRAHQDTISNSDLGNSTQLVSDAVQQLDQNVGEVQRLIDAINAAPAKPGEGGLLTGGSVTARLAAHYAQEGLTTVGEFSDNFQAASEALLRGFDTSETNNLFTRAANIDESRLVQSLNELSDHLARRADEVERVAGDSVSDFAESFGRATQAIQEMDGAVLGFTQRFAPEEEIWGAWRYYHTMGAGAGRVEAEVTDAHRAQYRELVENNQIQLPEGITLRQVLDYRNGEDLRTVPRNTSSPVNLNTTTEQRFLEANIANHNVPEALRNASTMLQRGDVDRYFESLKWAMLNYARDTATGNAAAANRAMQDFLGEFLSEMQGPRWYGSRVNDANLGPSPFSPEIIRATEQFAARLEDLAPNEMRAQWANVWDRTRNLRYSGDYRSEVKFDVSSARAQGMTDEEITAKVLERRTAIKWRDGFGATGSYGSNWAFRLGNTMPWAIKNNIPFRTDFQDDVGRYSLRAGRTFALNTLKYTIPAGAVAAYYFWPSGGSGQNTQTANNTVTAPAPTPVTSLDDAQTDSAQRLQQLNAVLSGGSISVANAAGYGPALMDPTFGIQAWRASYDQSLSAFIASSHTSAADRAQYQEILAQINATHDEFMDPTTGRFARDLAAIEQSMRTHTLPQLDALDRRLRNVDASGAPLSTPPPTAQEAAQIIEQQQQLIQEMSAAHTEVIEARLAQITEIQQTYAEAIGSLNALPSAFIPADINVALPDGTVLASNTAVDPSGSITDLVRQTSLYAQATYEVVPVDTSNVQVASLYEAIGLSNRAMENANDAVSSVHAIALQDINSLSLLQAQAHQTAQASDNPEAYAELLEQIDTFVEAQTAAIERDRQNFSASSSDIQALMARQHLSIQDGMTLQDATRVLTNQLVAQDGMNALHAQYSAVAQNNRDARGVAIVAFLEALQAGQALDTVPEVATEEYEAPDLSALADAAPSDGSEAPVVDDAEADVAADTSGADTAVEETGGATVTEAGVQTPTPTPVGTGGNTTTATPAQATVPQWQQELDQIRTQASSALASARADADFVTNFISNTDSDNNSLAEYIGRSQGIIDQANEYISDLRMNTDLAPSDRNEYIRNLERMIARIEQNNADINALVPGLEEASEHIQQHLDEAERLEAQIRGLNTQGDIARARQLNTQLQEVKAEIGEHQDIVRARFTDPAFEKYSDSLGVSFGDDEDPRYPGNEWFRFQNSARARLNDNLIGAGGGEYGLLNQWFGSDGPNRTSVVGEWFGIAKNGALNLREQWIQNMRDNSRTQSERNTMNAINTGFWIVGGLAGVSIVKQVLGWAGVDIPRPVSILATLAVIGYALHRSGIVGQELVDYNNAGNPFALGPRGSSTQTNGGGNLIRTGATSSDSPATSSGADSSNVIRFPVQDRNGNRDDHIFVHADGSMAAQRHGGGNLVFSNPIVEESIRDEVDTSIAQAINRMSGQGQHIPEIINGQVEVIFRYPSQQPGDAPAQSVLVDFSEDREDALRIAQTANAG